MRGTAKWRSKRKCIDRTFNIFARSEAHFHQQPLVKAPAGKAKPRGSGGDEHGHAREEGSGYSRGETVVEKIPPN